MDASKNLIGFIPEEFDKECRALNIPCAAIFRYDFLGRHPDPMMVKIKYSGREIEAPKILFPHAIEIFERRKFWERKGERERLQAEERAGFARERERQEARRQALREEFPKMFQARC